MGHWTTNYLAQRCGFPVCGRYRFKLGGLSYCVGSAGVRTLSLLAEIHAAYTPQDGSWLLRLRGRIRQIQAYNATSVLCLVVERTDDPRFRILAIWLRGRCRGSLGSASLAKFCTHPDDQTRKAVARALVRMGAWQALRPMAQRDPNLQIQRIATARPPRPFPSRLSHCLLQFSATEVKTRAGGLFVAPNFSIRQGRPPKSPAYIRMILERIRNVVARQAQ